MRTPDQLVLLPLAMILLALGGCAHHGPARVPTRSVADPTARWSDSDSQQLAEALARDCVAGAWRASRAAGHKPVLVVGAIRNEGEEHIAVGAFVTDLEGALAGSGVVTLPGDPDQRRHAREGRSGDALRAWGREQGAEFALEGVLRSTVGRSGDPKPVGYRVDLTLVRLSDGGTAWSGSQEIHKAAGAGWVRDSVQRAPTRPPRHR